MQQQQKGKEKSKKQEVSRQEVEDSEMEEFDGPTNVGELAKQGISETDIKKLVEAGYHTVEAVAFTPRKQLVLVKGLSEAKIDKILEAC